ncbi:MAG: chemotaxis protein CheW [Pikeienuella sp.]
MEAHTTRPKIHETHASQTFLSFRLQGELFALPVERVQEILDPLPVTPVPQSDQFVPGLVNVRGSIVPVVDLRHRLGMPSAAPAADNRMIVLEANIDQIGSTKLALVADSVEQVLEIDGATIEPVPEIGLRFPAQFLDGLAKRDGDLIIVLRTESVFMPAPSESKT